MEYQLKSFRDDGTPVEMTCEYIQNILGEIYYKLIKNDSNL